MTERSARTFGRGPTPAVSDMLQVLFGLELAAPSERVWVVAPWQSDIPVLDNRSGEFSAVGPGWPLRMIRLSEVLASSLDRGTVVTVVMKDDPSNVTMRVVVESLQASYPERCRLIIEEQVHEKGIVTDHAYLSGSMNWTFNGQKANLEKVLLETQPATIAIQQLELAGLYEWEGVA
jgi:hypothetical protein